MRAVALLGILTINVTGFWGPAMATFSPHLPRAEPGGDVWFLIAFVLFEGKMRALFTLLFGASLLLFVDAADRRGHWGPGIQARRFACGLKPPRGGRFRPWHRSLPRPCR